MAKKKANSQSVKQSAANKSASKRSRVSQSDVPAHSLRDALRVPQTLVDNYGKSPTRPLRVAEAMDMSPTSSTFKMITGSAIAYGLTSGGYNAESISLDEVGRRITAPTAEGDDATAKLQALTKPRVVREFLEKYDGSPLPPENIAKNVLEEMGVPGDRTDRTYELIVDNARYVGILREMKGKQYVDLKSHELSDNGLDDNSNELDPAEEIGVTENSADTTEAPDTPTISHNDDRLRKVFITHGKNKKFIDPIKELLGFGDYEPVVSVERESVSKPVPQKVMDDMRSCSAAIIHVEEEQLAPDDESNSTATLNPNVLIEIGAAMALYGPRFILLVREGVKLPSNLQGLYEVRYDGDGLDAEGTIKVLKALKDIKNHPLPTYI